MSCDQLLLSPEETLLVESATGLRSERHSCNFVHLCKECNAITIAQSRIQRAKARRCFKTRSCPFSKHLLVSEHMAGVFTYTVPQNLQLPAWNACNQSHGDCNDRGFAHRADLKNIWRPWASDGEHGGALTPWILKISAKKVVFLISSGKKQIPPLLTPPWRNFRKIP